MRGYTYPLLGHIHIFCLRLLRLICLLHLGGLCRFHCLAGTHQRILTGFPPAFGRHLCVPAVQTILSSGLHTVVESHPCSDALLLEDVTCQHTLIPEVVHILTGLFPGVALY